MRWDSLFDDLEAQLDVERAADDAALRVDEERQRRNRIELRDRLALLVRDSVPFIARLTTGTSFRCVASGQGADWLSGEIQGGGARRAFVLPFAGIAGIQVSASTAVESSSGRAPSTDSIGRFGLAMVLRDLARRRAPVEIVTHGGSVRGTIDLVAGDHLDLALHEVGVPRRNSEVRGVELVPLAAIVLVTC